MAQFYILSRLCSTENQHGIRKGERRYCRGDRGVSAVERGGGVPTRLRRVARRRQRTAAFHSRACRVVEWHGHSNGRRVVAASVLPRRPRFQRGRMRLAGTASPHLVRSANSDRNNEVSSRLRTWGGTAASPSTQGREAAAPPKRREEKYQPSPSTASGQASTVALSIAARVL